MSKYKMSWADYNQIEILDEKGAELFYITIPSHLEPEGEDPDEWFKFYRSPKPMLEAFGIEWVDDDWGE